MTGGSEGASALADHQAEDCPLDPYAYQPGIGSRIAGLAAGQSGHDPNYVFHTDYVAAGRGDAHATVRFRGLAAKEGVLLVRIHLLRQDVRPQLVLVTSERIAFNRLAQLGGEITVRFEAFNNCLYAVYGGVLGETDARADGLEIVLHKPRQVHEAGYHTEARNSAHGRTAVRAQAMLLSTATPTLAAPVSQVATPEQLRSAEARRILAEADLPASAGAAERWAVAYTVRCLEAYGMLADDARGLCLGSPADPVARVLDGRSVAVDCVHGPDGAPLLSPDQLVNYDFIWRSDLLSAGSSPVEWAANVERLINALLPGGFAVVTFGYDPHPSQVRGRPGETSRIVNRGDVERLALILVSRGHEVAQLRIVGAWKPLPGGDGQPCSVAGLVVRRAWIPE